MGDNTLCGSPSPSPRCRVETIFEVVGACGRDYRVVEVVPAVDDAVAEVAVPLIASYHQFTPQLASPADYWSRSLDWRHIFDFFYVAGYLELLDRVASPASRL